MSFQHKIVEVQKHLRKHAIDGWLLYDFHRRNEYACQFLEIPSSTHLTRRLFYWIPQEGIPIKIVHAVEPFVLDHLPGDKKSYQTWESFDLALKELLHIKKVVAMEYSPRNRIPYVSVVDGGILDLIKELGVKVVSSGDFLQYFTCVWTPKELELHLEAAAVLEQIAAATWQWIASQLKKKATFSEYDIQQFIFEEVSARGCVMEGKPICAVNANAADPHYNPSPKTSTQIKPGDLILIDLWCKKKQEGAVYADITRMACAGLKGSPKQEEIFKVVRRAQKKATDFIQTSLDKGHPVKGCDVDRICRQEIEEAGYGKYFIHRTGHNIHTETHGPGANLDSFETLDERALLPNTCFSIEPGIYLPGEFGIRLEHDVYIHETGKIQITGGIQDELICLSHLAD
ncbi:MAG: M24 family metallopeptidase [Rhabdochlamydiaceae bacterium]|jgi:Xaa-Pro aminopeptidase